MANDFIDSYLREFEERHLKVRPISSTRTETTHKEPPRKVLKETLKSSKVYSVCTSCGTKQNIIVEGEFCPKCGRGTLITSDKFTKTNAPKKETCISHASALLDEGDGYINSPLQKIIKEDIKNKKSAISEASALLDDDSPIMELPMPDFSQYIKKPIQDKTQETQVTIPPEFQIIQPININDIELDMIVQQNLGKGV